MNAVKTLMEWYGSNCDGDWEHTFGVKIETLDNPGWAIAINLTETDLEGRTIEKKSVEDDDDWYIVTSDGETFKGYGDPDKLQFLFDEFENFIKS